MSSSSFTSPEGEDHGPRLHSKSGDECVRGASRQRQGPRALLEAHVMARSHQAHLRQRCLRPSVLGDVSTNVGVPVLSSLPRLNNSSLAKCGCKKHALDLYGDHTSTCTAHSGATKAHDWMVSVLGPLFRTAGHTVRTQHGVTASAGQRRGDVEIRSYLRIKPGAGAWYSTSALPTTGLGQAATCSRTVCYRILRTLMARYVLLRSVQQQVAGHQGPEG